MRHANRLPALAVTLPLLLSIPAFAAGAAQESSHPGKLTGVVTSGATGRAIAGAYVGVGDFGDSGGSNYARHREQGLHAATTTDADGRFELAGLVYTGPASPVKLHPLIVTHRDFVPFRTDVALPEGADVSVAVVLTPAAVIEATAVNADGEPLSGPCLLRLEAADGHRFVPPGRDRHLSAFASSHWSEVVRDGRFTFTELAAGDYSIAAIRLAVPERLPAPEGYRGPMLAASSTRFHGQGASLRVAGGVTTRVSITPADYGTHLTVTLPRLPADRKPSGLLRFPFVVISTNAGLAAWADGKGHSPEDSRLGRIAKEALISGFVPSAVTFAVENLPPGAYSVFAGPAVFLQGTTVELARGVDTRIELPWRDPEGHARVNLERLDRPVRFEARRYRVPELCEVLSAAVESRPIFRAHPSLADAEITPRPGETIIWDLIETFWIERRWRVHEEGDEVLVLGPDR